MFKKAYDIGYRIITELVKLRGDIKLLNDNVEKLVYISSYRDSETVEVAKDESQQAIDAMYKTKAGLYSFKKAKNKVKEDAL